MKKVLLILAVAFCAIACSKGSGGGSNLPAGKDSLAGTIWEAVEDEYDPDLEDYAIVYILRFLTANTGEKYVNDVKSANFSYTYDHPNIKYKEGDIIEEGTVSDSKIRITFSDLEFWKVLDTD